MATLALTREVSPSIGSCELTHLDRQAIDVDVAREQHAAYEDALRECGCEVLRLPPLPECPDAVFVEDTAVVVDEVAVVTRPGAVPRREEIPSMEEALRPYRSIERIEAPGILDGGDVLHLGRRFFVGLSSRTNEAGLSQLRDHLAPFGYEVIGATVDGCLHFKSAVTAIGENAVLANPEWVDVRQFGDASVVEVHPAEGSGANAVMAGGRLIYPAEFPETRRRLMDAGFDVVTVPAAELAKAEGAVTCCSILLNI